jgi:hypothetical protein
MEMIYKIKRMGKINLFIHEGKVPYIFMLFENIGEDKLPYTRYTRPDQKLWGRTVKRDMCIYRLIGKSLSKWAPSAGTQAFQRSCQ